MMQINELLDKIWDAFYKEEDELEKKFVGTAESDAWFSTYRYWMQQGFNVAIDVIAKEKERANNFVSLRSTSPCGTGRGKDRKENDK